MVRTLFAASVAISNSVHGVHGARIAENNEKSWIVGVDDVAIYDATPTTSKGCVCREPCVTSSFFSCYSQMFCAVESENCSGGKAEWSIWYGHYDYCQFPAHQPYEDLTAAEKKMLLLHAVNNDRTVGEHISTAQAAIGILTESMMVSFDAVGDIFPMPRTKVIHNIGFVGAVRFETYGGHEYTGFFKGAEHGLIRFSSATLPGRKDKFTPGFGLKFLRDGQCSANLVAMPSLDPQLCSEENFFSRDFTTKVNASDNFKLGLVKQKFLQATYCPQQVGLSDFASEPGTPPMFPYILTFRSDLNVRFPCDMDALRQNGFGRESLAEGTVLFEVLATPSPGGDPNPIGRIVLTSSITGSKFGDEQLFFRHQRKEEDWALRPEWLNSVDRAAECGMAIASDVPPTREDGCFSSYSMVETDTESN